MTESLSYPQFQSAAKMMEDELKKKYYLVDRVHVARVQGGILIFGLLVLGGSIAGAYAAATKALADAGVQPALARIQEADAYAQQLLSGGQLRAREFIVIGSDGRPVAAFGGEGNGASIRFTDGRGLLITGQDQAPLYWVSDDPVADGSFHKRFEIPFNAPTPNEPVTWWKPLHIYAELRPPAQATAK